MDSERCFCTVDGYHQQTPRAKEAEALGFANRFAFVLETYRSFSDDMVYDAVLIEAIIDGIEGVLGAKAAPLLRVPDVLGQKHLIDLDDKSDAPSSEDQISFLQDGKIVGLLEIEPWFFIGGPQPYHDSYTMSLYTTESHAPALNDLAHRLEIELDARITETLVSAAQPFPPGPLWRRLLKAVFC